MKIATKRIYDEVSESDGKRILVDRLWPRGIKKENAKIDLWPKEITPSNELRKWYHQDIDSRWDEFQQRYRAELNQQIDKIIELRDMAKKEQITLLTSAKNEDRNHVVVLKQLIEESELSSF